MKASLLVLLSSLLQLCSGAQMDPLTCSDFNDPKASNMAVQHINKHHRHGYKFSIEEVAGAHLEKVGRPGVQV